jgi:hypothetical protein
MMQSFSDPTAYPRRLAAIVAALSPLSAWPEPFVLQINTQNGMPEPLVVASNHPWNM